MSFLNGLDPLSIKDVQVGGKVVWTRVRYLIDGLKELPEDERREIFSNFCCHGCGDFDPEGQCYCMADD